MSTKETNNTSDLKSFHYLENGEVTFSILDTIKTVKEMDSGVYGLSIVNTPTGSKLEVKSVIDGETIKLHNFTDKEKLDKLFASFFNKKVVKKMIQLGFHHKVGVLLYGKEGTGKSTIIKKYYTDIINKYDGLVFYINGTVGLNNMWDFIMKVRTVQDNPIIVVFEEMDCLIMQGYESQLKKMFDGNESISNCLIFATTNYIDKIPSALRNRPSRFKYVLNIQGIESADEIYELLQKLIGDLFEPTEIVDFSRELVGSSLDCIKQFALDKIMDLTVYNTSSKEKIGFNLKTS